VVQVNIYAQSVEPAIDLTEGGAVARTTFEATIFDTRTVEPQLQAAARWYGPIGQVHDHLPPHGRTKAEIDPGPANNLRPGGLSDEVRATGGELFPGIQQTRWSPPDPTLAVGPEYVVETVNSTLAFFTRQGQMTFSVALDSTGNPGFFEEVGAGDFVVDPRVLYDQYTERFVITAIEVYFHQGEAAIDIAVSDDSDPNGIWYKYRTDAVIRVGNKDYWLDYPAEGYDLEAFYVSGNLFTFSGGGTAGVLFRIFEKAPMLIGDPVTVADLRDGGTSSVQAAHCFGSPQAAFFASHSSNRTSMEIHAITDPVGSPALVTANVTVPLYSLPARYSVPNLGGMIDSLDGRVINVHWRDGNLYTGHPIWSGGKNVARWYHFRTNNWPASGSPTLVQSGNIDEGAGVHTFFPAVFSNAAGDVGLVVAKSSADTVPSIEVTGRKASDPPGQMGALEQVKLSDGGYGGRYGDYFDICVDPADDETFWINGEYANGPYDWGTWISSFTVGGGEVICEDIKKFKAKCRKNGTIKVVVKLKDNSHNGDTVTIGIVREAIETVINGKKAKARRCCFNGLQPTSLLKPAQCVDPIMVDCK